MGIWACASATLAIELLCYAGLRFVWGLGVVESFLVVLLVVTAMMTGILMDLSVRR